MLLDWGAASWLAARYQRSERVKAGEVRENLWEVEGLTASQLGAHRSDSCP